MRKLVLLTAAAILVPGMALAGNCPNLMEEIDKILAAQPELDANAVVDEDSGKSVRQLRNEGEAMHSSGNHAKSVALLETALEVLKDNN